MVSTDHYTVLGVRADAPPEVIRAAYRALAQKHHPDRAQDPGTARVSMTRLNEAYAVLSDPGKRRAYDRARVESAPQPPQDPVRWNGNTAPVSIEVGGYRYGLNFMAGFVISNDVWSDTHVSSRGGGGYTLMGYGYYSRPKVTSEVIPRQRIGVRTRGGRDVFLEQSGSHLPVACGQHVEVVRAFSHHTRREANVALVNRDGGQWFWVGSSLDAGQALCGPAAAFWDFVIFLAVAGGLGVLGWHFVHGWFHRALYVLIGGPLLVGSCSFLLWRTASKISDGIGRAITVAVQPSAPTAMPLDLAH
ncbi:MAG: hypothetical protein B7Z66_14930 [Chromatiales bacterium 21-64-14]|nr:MAG: hypothetical protein B7Z66_14930 [Chromatiales bacterium 21-64-14]